MHHFYQGHRLHVVRAGAVGLEAHQLNEFGGVRDLGGADAEALQILRGQIDPTEADVFLDVAEDVRQLESNTAFFG